MSMFGEDNPTTTTTTTEDPHKGQHQDPFSGQWVPDSSTTAPEHTGQHQDTFTGQWIDDNPAPDHSHDGQTQDSFTGAWIGDHTPYVPDVYNVPTQMQDGPPVPTTTPHDAPPVPTYGDGDGGDDKNITVSTHALDTFSHNITLLSDDLKQAHTLMGQVNIHPGAFFEAFQLSKKINGDGGLAATTETTLTNAINALAEISNACSKLSSRYTTTEELSSADAQTFSDLVGNTNAVINSVLSDQTKS